MNNIVDKIIEKGLCVIGGALLGLIISKRYTTSIKIPILTTWQTYSVDWMILIAKFRSLKTESKK